MKKEIINPKCRAHSDCFANVHGECTALIENDFGKRDCPFYRTKEENLRSRIAANERLAASGEIGLIEKYHTSSGLFENEMNRDKAELSALCGN